MKTYIVACCLALVVSAIVTPFVAWLACKKGWLDQPDQVRKVHQHAVPRIGGIAVILAFFAPILGLAIYENDVSDLLYSDQGLVVGLSLGALSIAALGIYDDVKGANARLKLLVQTTTAIMMWNCGFRIEILNSPIGEVINLGVLSLPLTVLWMVGVINALNLIDGLDGLASGVALFAATVLFGVSFIGNSALLCLLTVSLVGALLGFLLWNFNPARIFLGDTGSMFLGFVLAVISVWTQQKGATAAALLIPVLALGLPILDTTLSFVRRIRNGRSPFQADREHLHHRLLAIGFSHRGAVLTLYTVSILFCLGALVLLETDAIRRAVALSIVVCLAVLLARKLGGFLSGTIEGSLRSAVPSITADRDTIRDVVRSVRSAASLEDAWSRIVPVFALLDAEAVRLTWLEEDKDTVGSSGRIFYWQKDGLGSEVVDRAEPNTRAMNLEHNARCLGEFVSVFGEDTDVDQDPTLPIYLELLAESLVENRLSRVQPTEETLPPPSDVGEVVNLARALR